MLEPLFDRYCNHVGWLERDRCLFDCELNWLAFIQNNHVWSKEPVVSVGLINGVICMDTEGKVVAWGVGQRITGDPSIQRKPKIIPSLPEEPTGILRPMLPTPQLPATPLTGWSPLSFDEWTLHQ